MLFRHQLGIILKLRALNIIFHGLQSWEPLTALEKLLLNIIELTQIKILIRSNLLKDWHWCWTLHSIRRDVDTHLCFQDFNYKIFNIIYS